MKLGILTILTAVISFAVITFFKLELWAFLLFFVPVYLVIVTVFTAWYNMRGAIKPESIPPSGFANRISQMDSIVPQIVRLGFREIDRFYLKMIPDSVVYVFKHDSEPVYFCLYHLGTKMACDFVTRYGYDISLTTNNVPDAGVLPRPRKAMLQIFPGITYEQLYSNHISAHQFLLQNGVTTHDFPPAEFRSDFIEAMQKQWLYLKKHPIWPVTTIFKAVTKIGIGYRKPIQNQWKSIIPNLHNDL
jgi:hypothetical protein